MKETLIYSMKGIEQENPPLTNENQWNGIMEK